MLNFWLSLGCFNRGSFLRCSCHKVERNSFGIFVGHVICSNPREVPIWAIQLQKLLMPVRKHTVQLSREFRYLKDSFEDNFGVVSM